MRWFPTAPLSEVIAAEACAHALRDFPREACGLVVAGRYVPMFNYASVPERDFRMDPAAVLRATAGRPIEAVVHSHCAGTGQAFPSGLDMQQQIAMGVPWAIVFTDGADAGLCCMWGDALPIAPVVGRPFRHGVHDCYSLVRDVFRLGREALADPAVASNDGTAIDWPHPPILLPDYPRDDAWWQARDGIPPGDLYVTQFRSAGFREIHADEARAGDCFLLDYGPHGIVNHAGVLLGNQAEWMLHHMGNHLSCRSMTMLWRRHIRLYVRHESVA